jgi:hypothetical protein
MLPIKLAGGLMWAQAIRVLVLAAVVSATSSWAQLSASTLRGTATDQFRAVLAAAKIAAVNTETNLSREVETNENGDFEIVDLPRGVYQFTAAHPRFRTFLADKLVLESDQSRRINTSFELGAVGAEVTVRADLAVISTESAKIQTQFTSHRFTDTPIIGDARNPQSALSTLPLVQNACGLYSLKFAGQPTSQIQQAIDGHTNDGAGSQVDNLHDVPRPQAEGNDTPQRGKPVFFLGDHRPVLALISEGVLDRKSKRCNKHAPVILLLYRLRVGIPEERRSRTPDDGLRLLTP